MEGSIWSIWGLVVVVVWFVVVGGLLVLLLFACFLPQWTFKLEISTWRFLGQIWCTLCFVWPADCLLNCQYLKIGKFYINNTDFWILFWGKKSEDLVTLGPDSCKTKTIRNSSQKPGHRWVLNQLLFLLLCHNSFLNLQNLVLLPGGIYLKLNCYRLYPEFLNHRWPLLVPVTICYFHWMILSFWEPN